ncbi:MAG TPA: YceI family protein [Flavisolibacter sp.]|nr:YceI family protein [Flavisolibacter sp.]
MRKTNFLLALAALLLLTSCKKNETNSENYQLVAGASVAKWKGFLRTGYFNEGSLNVESENIRMSGDLVKSGTFVMPLSSIENFNLPTEALKEQLIHHLQSADFFNMVLHPNLSFTIENVKYHSDNDPESIADANFFVSGQLTMLGKSLPVSFPARIEKNGNQLHIAAKLKVDRTKWGMNYAADPALPDDQYILPEIEIELDLTAERN